jgi:hypothetical protein
MTRRDAGERAGCVPPEKLHDLVEGRGSEAERLELLDHVMACNACHKEFELLRAIVHARPRERRFKTRYLAIAASLAVIVGAGIIWKQLQNAQPASDTLRGPAEVVLVSPTGELATGESLAFVWRSVDGAVSYEVELSDADGNALYGAATPDTSLALPSSIALTPEKAYLWWVRARLADGRAKTSPALRFSLRAR